MPLILRALGAALLLFASLAASRAINRENARALSELSGFLALVRQIRTEIECFKRPLDEIYAEFSDSALDGIGFTAELRRGGFLSALDLCENRTKIPREDFGRLKSFAKRLGSGFTENEIAECERLSGILSGHCEALGAALPEKSRLCRSLCLLFGVSVAIILF